MLHLHIGTSKTGSTSIQNFLRRTDTTAFGLGQIACFGRGNAWRLAAAAGTRNAHRYWVQDRGLLTEAEFEANRAGIWDRLDSELAARRAGTGGGRGAQGSDFVVSSEYLYRHYFNAPLALGCLRERLLARFGDVRVLLYLRDQRAYLRSLHAQAVTGAERSTQDFTSFLARCRRVEALWNYRKGVQLWARVFGAGRLQVIVFDRTNFHDHDLIGDFLWRIAPDRPGLRQAATGLVPRNVSPGPAQLALLRSLNARGFPLGHPGDRLLRQLIEGRPGRLLGPFLAPRPDPRKADQEAATSHDAMILDWVSEGNAWLNRRFLAEARVKLPVAPGCGSEAGPG